MEKVERSRGVRGLLVATLVLVAGDLVGGGGVAVAQTPAGFSRLDTKTLPRLLKGRGYRPGRPGGPTC